MKYKFLVSCEISKEVIIEAESEYDAYDKAKEELCDLDMSDGDEVTR